MTKTHKIITLVLSTIGFIPIFLCGSCNIREIKYESGIAQIKKGQDRQEVTNLIGSPSEIRRCSLSKNNDNHSQEENCFEIYGYFTVFKYWAVAFNNDGKVIKTYRWSFDDGYGGAEGFGMPVTFW